MCIRDSCRTTLSRPEYLNRPNKDETMGSPFPSPRSWTNAARILGAAMLVGADKKTQRKLIGGCVGDEVGQEFLDFLDVDSYGDPEEILNNIDSNNFLQQNKLSRLNNAEIPKEYDGIAEIYWNSWDDLEGLADIENARMASKILMEDEAKFIKFSESPLLLIILSKIFVVIGSI